MSVSGAVSLREEGVDLSSSMNSRIIFVSVSLREEGVDLSAMALTISAMDWPSPSARREWI